MRWLFGVADNLPFCMLKLCIAQNFIEEKIVSNIEIIYFELRNTADLGQKKAVAGTTTKFREEMHEICCTMHYMARH